MPTGLPLPNTRRIYSSKWLPQVELLSHPAVKAGMHHCGFGGTLEFVNAGLPCVIFPHFGDQPFNAENILQAEIGVSLFHHWRAFREGADERNHFFTDPIFTAKDVTEAFKAILTEPKYRINAMKMRCASRTQGGRALAVQTVEQTYLQSVSNKTNYNQRIKMFMSQEASEDTQKKSVHRFSPTQVVDMTYNMKVNDKSSLCSYFL